LTQQTNRNLRQKEELTLRDRGARKEISEVKAAIANLGGDTGGAANFSDEIKGCTNTTAITNNGNTITTEFTDTATSTVVRRDVTTISGSTIETVKTWLPTGQTQTTTIDTITLEGGTI
jgi:hypothetical protein